MNGELVLIIDFGSQYSQLIARKVRENKVFCQIVPPDIPIAQVKSLKPKAIILSGGPSSVYQKQAPRCSQEILSLGIPVLGICYGMQLMTKMLGGTVHRRKVGEYGNTPLTIIDGGAIFEDVPKVSICWMSHKDYVSTLPEGFEGTAQTKDSPVAAFQNLRKRLFGVQFHPEVIHTEYGSKMLKNFVCKVAGCKGAWTMKSFIKESIREIKETVGEDKVILGLSGGVDSSVTAVLVNEAIGKNLIAIFVDNGLLRKGEGEEVKKVFKEHFKVNLRYVDARNEFLNKLQGIIDPEEKRKIIGNAFVKIFEREADRIGGVKFLAQGTLYPDWIESKSAFGGPSATIKTHHNVGGLPTEMELKLIEPLKYLFKDEVRILGKELGMPDSIVWRQPFPGPGLAVRTIGEVTEERLNILREVDDIVVAEIRKAGLYNKIWQSFGILLPLKTVGVMGDERTYENVVAIRAVTSLDGMTADWARLPYELMQKISNRIINEIKGVNRVVYDISSKPPATIEWE